jgi:hypothetical protein
VLTRGSGAKPHLEANPSEPTTTTLPQYHPRTANEIRLDAAYATGFDVECQRIWSLAPSGRLVDSRAVQHPYVLGDCTRRLASGARRALTVTAARTEGRHAADAVATALAPSRLLCWTRPNSLVLARCWDSRQPSTTVSPPTTSRSTTP